MNQCLVGFIGLILVNSAYADIRINGYVRQDGLSNPFDRQQESAPGCSGKQYENALHALCCANALYKSKCVCRKTK